MVPIIESEVVSMAAGATQNIRYGQGSNLATSGTEANRQTKLQTAGTVSKLYITILTNDRGASTFLSRKNAANGNMSISIGASATGEFEDSTNSDAIVAGDLYSLRFVAGSGGTTLTYDVVRTLFQATTNTVTIFTGNGSNVSGTDVFAAIASTAGSSGTEANNQCTAPIAGTWKKFGVYVSTNTRDGTVTYKTRKNTADGNQSLSITAAATGWFEDLVNTDTIAVGDLINYKGITGGTTGTVTLQIAKSAYESTTGNFFFAGSDNPTTNASTTVYYPVAGTGIAIATESNVVADPGSNFTASRLGVYVSVNTVVGASTFKFRKNAANGNQSASITGLTTGHFLDAVNTDVVLAADSIAIQLATGAAGTSMTTRVFEMGSLLTSGSSGETLLLMGVG